MSVNQVALPGEGAVPPGLYGQTRVIEVTTSSLQQSNECEPSGLT